MWWSSDFFGERAVVVEAVGRAAGRGRCRRHEHQRGLVSPIGASRADDAAAQIIATCAKGIGMTRTVFGWGGAGGPKRGSAIASSHARRAPRAALAVVVGCFAAGCVTAQVVVVSGTLTDDDASCPRRLPGQRVVLSPNQDGSGALAEDTTSTNGGWLLVGYNVDPHIQRLWVSSSGSSIAVTLPPARDFGPRATKSPDLRMPKPTAEEPALDQTGGQLARTEPLRRTEGACTP